VHWISWGWDTVPGEPIFVVHVAEMCPDAPLNAKRRLVTPCWRLDYSFTPSRIRLTDGGLWQEREPYVAYLIPRFRVWQEGPPRGVRVQQPHKCALEFMIQKEFGWDDRFKNNPPYYARFRDPDRVIGQTLIHLAATARTGGTEGYWTIRAQTWEFLQALQRARQLEPGLFELRGTDLEKPVDALVTRAVAYLQEHLAEPLTIRDLARHFHLGESTFSHRFTQALGEGPMKKLQRLRVLRAKVMLAQGWKLEAIAEATGFYDGHYLSRVFKQVEGRNPQQFLSSLKKETPPE